MQPHVVPDLLQRHVAAHGLETGMLEQLAHLLGGFFKKSRKFHALVAHAGKLVQNALQVVAGVLARGVQLIGGGEMLAHGNAPLLFFGRLPGGRSAKLRYNIHSLCEPSFPACGCVSSKILQSGTAAGHKARRKRSPLQSERENRGGSSSCRGFASPVVQMSINSRNSRMMPMPSG